MEFCAGAEARAETAGLCYKYRLRLSPRGRTRPVFMVACFSHADERLDIAVSDVAWSPRLDFPVDFCVVVEERRREWVRTYVEPLSVMEDTCVTIACFSHIDGRLHVAVSGVVWSPRLD